MSEKKERQCEGCEFNKVDVLSPDKFCLKKNDSFTNSNNQNHYVIDSTLYSNTEYVVYTATLESIRDVAIIVSKKSGCLDKKVLEKYDSCIDYFLFDSFPVVVFDKSSIDDGGESFIENILSQVLQDCTGVVLPKRSLSPHKRDKKEIRRIIGLIISIILLVSAIVSVIFILPRCVHFPSAGNSNSSSSSGENINNQDHSNATYNSLLLNADGGIFESGLDTKVISFSENLLDVSKLPIPQKDYCRFAGWSDGNNTIGETLTITGNLLLFAIWEPLEFDLVLNAGEGLFPDSLYNTGTSDNHTFIVKITSDDTYATLADAIPELKGYSFAGWSIPDGTPVTVSSVIDMNYLSLNAIWVANGDIEYRVNYYLENLSDSNYELFESVKLTGIANQKIDINPSGAIKDYVGFSLLCMNEDTNESAIPKPELSIDSTTILADGTRVINVFYLRDLIKVTLDANGGFVEKDELIIKYGATFGSIPNAYRSGYGFVGWYNTNGERIYSDSKVELIDPIKLIAKWDSNSISIFLQLDGGTCSISSLSAKYGDIYAGLVTPSKDGYNFIGWFDPSGIEIKNGMKVASTTDFTLTAKWSPKEITISFDAKGGNTSTTSKKVSYAGTYGELPTPSRVGYNFSGWYNSSGKEVTSRTVVENSTNHTLTAKWSPKEITVSFDAKGGSVSITSKKVTYAGTYGELPTPSRTGYTFDGWYVADGKKVTSSTKVSATVNFVLYAHWTENQISSWVPRSQLPANADIVNQKWIYTKTDYTENTASSLAGWTRYGSYTSSSASESGSQLYGAYQNGINDNGTSATVFYNPNNFWNTVKNQSAAPYANGTFTKGDGKTYERRVSNESAGFVYWHWMYSCPSIATVPRAITDYYGTCSKNNFVYKNLCVFIGGDMGTRLAGNTFDSLNGYQGTVSFGKNGYDVYKITSITANSQTAGSPYWYRFPISKCSYADYLVIFKYSKSYQQESTSLVTDNGSTITNVQEYVQYRMR